MLTKKHFKQLARIVGQAKAAQSLGVTYDTTAEIVIFCRGINPKFQGGTFREAVDDAMLAFKDAYYEAHPDA